MARTYDLYLPGASTPTFRGLYMAVDMPLNGILQLVQRQAGLDFDVLGPGGQNVVMETGPHSAHLGRVRRFAWAVTGLPAFELRLQNRAHRRIERLFQAARGRDLSEAELGPSERARLGVDLRRYRREIPPADRRHANRTVWAGVTWTGDGLGLWPSYRDRSGRAQADEMAQKIMRRVIAYAGPNVYNRIGAREGIEAVALTETRPIMERLIGEGLVRTEDVVEVRVNVVKALYRLGEMAKRDQDDRFDDGVRPWVIEAWTAYGALPEVIATMDPAVWFVADMFLDESDLGDRKVYFANPSGDERASVWVIWFDVNAATNIAVEARSLDDALEEAAQAVKDWGWLGMFTEPDYAEAASDEGIETDGLFADWQSKLDEETWEKIRDAAETDLTYTESGYIASDDWGYTYDPEHVPAELHAAFVAAGQDWPEEEER